MWEYDVVGWGMQHTYDGQSGINGLKALMQGRGLEGWELVSATPGGPDTGLPPGLTLIFKRLVPR